jgi:hypothetical protein
LFDCRTNDPSASVTDTRAGLKDLLAGLQNTEPLKTCLEQYLADAHDKTSLFDEFDILNWWKVNAPKYPILARIVKDVLAVPISTVASESTFSTSGRVLSSVRNALNNESMEALICAQDWLRVLIKGIILYIFFSIFKFQYLLTD